MATSEKVRPTLTRRDDDALKIARAATVSLELTAPGEYSDGTRGEGWNWSLSAAPYRVGPDGRRTVPSTPGGMYKMSLPLGHGATLLKAAQYIAAQEAAMALGTVPTTLLLPGEQTARNTGRSCPASHRQNDSDVFCPLHGHRLEQTAANATANAPTVSASAPAGLPDDIEPADMLAFRAFLAQRAGL